MRNTLLRAIVFTLNKDPESYKDGADGITLNVGGMLISGILVPHKTFIEQPQCKTLKHFSDIFDASRDAEEVAKREEEFGLEDTNFLYLKNACYYVGDKPIPSNSENYMSVHIDSIDAYNMGELKVEK